MTVAIDFDDTITEPSPFPITGKIRSEVPEILLNLKSKGVKLILWTCRSGKYLREAKRILKEEKLLQLFDSVNKNLPESKVKSSKVYADYYIDDHIQTDMNWERIYKDILNRMEKN